MAAPGVARQQAAKARLGELFAHPASVYVVHYACQSLRRPEASGSPRIACIAARNLGTGQVLSFSVHQELELAARARDGAASDMDALERRMLDGFFAFLATNRSMRVLHWGMRDVIFGFAALEHRHAALGGSPETLHASQLYDLSVLLADLYGSDYVPAPRIESLARRNGLALTGFLKGAEEPEHFNRAAFGAVLQSTLCKVTVFSGVAQLASEGQLKTDATWWTMNVGRVREAYEMIWNNPVRATASIVFAGLSAGFVLVWRLMGG